MQIFLVRHGKTGGNAAHRHQSDTTGLTSEGVAQAKAVAKVLYGYKPTHLVSSPLVRTLETAREIGAEINMIAETNPVFIEIVRPRHLKGHHFSSLTSMLFYFRWYFGFTNTEKDGGETYRSLRNRVKAAQDFLATYPPDSRVVVVTHSVFINFFLFHLCNPKPVSMFRVPLVFLGILRIPNASVIPIIFDSTAPVGVCSWRRGIDSEISLS